MKNRIKVLSGLVIVITLLAMTLSGSVFAGSTTKSLSTNFTLVNLSTGVNAADANVTVSYMKADGTTWVADPANTSFTIPKNFGMNQVRQYFDTTLTPGQGSVTVSSDQPLGAIVQILARNQTPSQGAYIGYSEGSNSFFVPIAQKNNLSSSGLVNSQIVVQNTDSSTFSAIIDLYSGTTLTYEKITPSLKPGQSFYYDLADETEANLPSPWVGSAVVTGQNSGKVAVVSNLFSGPDGLQTFNGFPSENAGPTWMIPLFFSRLNNGESTTVTVQNLSGGTLAAHTVALTCKADNVSTPPTISVDNPADIAANTGYSFNPVTQTSTFPSNWGGSCEINAGANNNVVVIVQMRFVNAAYKGVAAYEAISETGVTGKTMVVPLIGKRLPNGFASVVAIQNMDKVNSASVTLTYMPSFNSNECAISICDKNGDGIVNASDAYVVGPLTIPAGESIQRNHRLPSGNNAEVVLPDGWVGSLTVVSSDSNINGFVQLTNYLNNLGDTFMAHDVFVLP